MSVPEKAPGLPRDVLRPRFWEVAADRKRSPFATPFEKHRRMERRSIEDMAGLMHMSVDAYVAFEQGEVRPVPSDILTYCEGLHLHPLDLYAEPYPGTPLPEELRDALLIAYQSQRYDPAFRDRARVRLTLEHERSNGMLRSNKDELHPLMISLGYSPDLRRFHAPFYDCDDDSISAQMQELVEGGEDNARGLINAYLNAYQLVLEKEVTVHANLHRVLDRDRRINAKKMESMARVLYQDSGPEVVARLRQKIIETQEITVLKTELRDNPQMFGKFSSSATEGKAIGAMSEEGRALLQERVLFLMLSARQDTRFEAALKNQLETVKASLKAYRDFSTWRESPRTQHLFDWFENALTLEHSLGGEHGSIRSLLRQRTGGMPAP